MHLASVHVHPAVTIPLALAAAIGFGWYWWRLGRPSHGRAVPPARRRVRRCSLFILLVMLPVMVNALSFLDPTIDPQKYVIAWVTIGVLLLALFIMAVVDALTSVRLQADELSRDVERSAADLAEAIQRSQELAEPASTAGKQGTLRAADHGRPATEGNGS